MDNNNIPMAVVVKSQSQSQDQNDDAQNNQTTESTTVVVKNATAQVTNPFNSKEERGKASRQIIAAFIANLGTINTGLVFGFSAVVIPQLKLSDSLIKINESQASWIGKLIFILKK